MAIQTIKFEDANAQTCLTLFSRWFNAQIENTLSKIEGVTFSGDANTTNFSFSIGPYNCNFSYYAINSNGVMMYHIRQSGSANGSPSGTSVCVLKASNMINGKHILEVSYSQSENIFIVDSIIANGIVQSSVPFSCVICPDTILDVIYCGYNGRGMLMNTISNGRPTDSWTEVPISGLMNSVKIWSAQFGIYTNERIFRFKTGARFFPSIAGKYARIEGLGDFIILNASESGDVVNGLIYKI